MTPTFEEQVSIFRSVAHMRQLSTILAPFSSASGSEKLSRYHRNALAALLHEVADLMQGCPADAVLYRDPHQTDGERGEWEKKLRAAVDPEEERVADFFADPSS